MIRIGVIGARGRMGQRIINLAEKDGALEVVFGFECKAHPDIGRLIEKVKITDDYRKINECDCIIDFSSSFALKDHLSIVLGYQKPFVVGMTGLEESEKLSLKEAANKIPIVFSPNMSIGVNLLFRLISQAAGVLKGYKADVWEAHHIHKKDSPSGTAKMIAEILNQEGYNIKQEEITAVREDEIVGDHKVILESAVDRIELSHSAKTRDIFAQGALLGARWVVSKKSGLFSMDDILFENKKKDKHE